MEKNSLLSLLLVLIFWPILGQEQTQNSYLFEKAQQEYYEQNPKALERAIEFDKIAKRHAQLKREGHDKAGEKYVIPVVFRVYDTKYLNDSNGNITNVTDEKVL
ncbi:hypothetical protein [uncultured Aquimarina sp.]|uniref:hypothetical protein n=1 Tax=uncultured Aquimarina sp. TaxID=575652 RepID=UPI002601CB92|nr:hypothetical protein [uncultured Aquimarina sp.]